LLQILRLSRKAGSSCSMKIAFIQHIIDNLQFRMKSFLLLFCSLIYLNSFGQVLENNSFNNKYFYRNNQLFGADSNVYTGDFKEYYPGKVKTEGSYINGLKSGTFRLYSDDGESVLWAIENYSAGHKDGVFKKFYKNSALIRNLISIENYRMDSLNDCYYWDRSGQLVKTVIHNQMNTYEIDSSILTIIVYIKGEFGVFLPDNDYRAIKKKIFCKKNPIEIQVAKVTCSNCWDPDQNIIDTLVLNDFKVISYSISGYSYRFKKDSGQTEFRFSKINGNKISDYLKSKVCNNYRNVFWLENIIILDKNNVEYFLPATKYEIFD
jgi:hypothetical protein